MGCECSLLMCRSHSFLLGSAFSLIGVLLLGYLDESGSTKDDDDSRSYLPNNNAKSNDGFAVPLGRPPARAVPSSMLPKDDDDSEPDVDPLG